jgi:hypothetical protein
MQYLLTEVEMAQLKVSNPNLERVKVLLEFISANPYSNEVKLDLFKSLTKELINSETSTLTLTIEKWEKMLFPH